MQDWDPDWKVPVNKTEMEHPDNEEEDQGNGQGNGQGDGIGDAQRQYQKQGKRGKTRVRGQQHLHGRR
jgi:hypothetical protein